MDTGEPTMAELPGGRMVLCVLDRVGEPLYVELGPESVRTLHEFTGRVLGGV